MQKLLSAIRLCLDLAQYLFLVMIDLLRVFKRLQRRILRPQKQNTHSSVSVVLDRRNVHFHKVQRCRLRSVCHDHVLNCILFCSLVIGLLSCEVSARGDDALRCYRARS